MLCRFPRQKSTSAARNILSAFRGKEMAVAKFGESLRRFRQASNDPDRLNRRLTQERLGELMGYEMGDLGYSGAAISDWERGESKISAEDRKVLMTLIQILHRCDGLKTPAEADLFLESGNYRALDEDETRKIFQDLPNGLNAEQIGFEETDPQANRHSALAGMFSISENEMEMLIAKAKEGPEPSWPRVLAALMRKVSDRFSPSMSTILWVAVGVMTMWLISPSLRFPFADHNSAFVALSLYAGASLIIPLLVGALVNTKDSEYWNQQSKVNPFLLRLYTYQGAGVGFNVGYFLVFPLSLARHYLGLDPSIWIEILVAIVSLILGNMGARVVPHNLWFAFKQLRLRDGWIFFVVAFMGPLWAFFFLEFYSTLLQPVLGIIMILLALIGVILVTRMSSQK